MNRNECIDLLTKMEANYPESFRRPELAATMLAEYEHHFADDEADIVFAAVDAIIATSTAHFAPKIGEIRREIIHLQHGYAAGADEAWNLIYKAICDSTHHAGERFAELPKTLQKIVGSPSQLKAWAMMDAKSLSFVQASITKAYEARIETGTKVAALPPAIRERLAALPMMIGGTE